MTWFLFPFLFLFAVPDAQAYPEMVRHGYFNCTSCHASPSGGGILSPYGKALSKEVLSRGRWFFEPSPANSGTKTAENKDEQFLYGMLETPGWLSLGGDIRLLQIVRDTPTEISGRFIFMQADLEALVDDGKRFKAVATLGRSEPRGRATRPVDSLISRRHWISVKVGDEKAEDAWNLRAGRFFPAYGLNIAEHASVIRRSLGFDQEQETYNAELSFQNERWAGAFTAVLGRPDNFEVRAEEGFSAQLARALGEGSSRVGANLYTGKAPGTSPDTRRLLGGAFGILGLDASRTLLAEVDAVHSGQKGWGIAEYLKMDWEFTPGVHAFATQEYARLSSLSPQSWQESYGIGLQYFPRVHWDWLLSVRQERSTAASRDFNTTLWVLLHYYL